MKKIKRFKLNWFVIWLLLFGVVFKLFITSNGNIIFHMDTARDYVDVREMVELKKPRLIGPTSAISGFFNGPGWYYLLAIGYVLFDGNPYGGVVLMILLWAVGGYFLYLLTHRYGLGVWLIGQLVWFGSPYITLATQYSFNPNPVLFLTPLFVYLLEKYLITEKLRWGIGTSILAGLFFHFEMNAGVFAPIIILVAILVLKKTALIRTKGFLICCAIFVSTLLPQFLFDLRHQFMMTKSILKFISESGGGGKLTILEKLSETVSVFYSAFIPGFVNNHYLIFILILISIVYFPIYFWRLSIKKGIDVSLIIALIIIVVPFLGYLILPVKVHSWHMGQEVVAAIIIASFLLSRVKEIRFGNLLTFGFVVAFLVYNCYWINYQVGLARSESKDPSLLRNEIAAIDFVYKSAVGENFNAYAFLPSVIDYPYQYLFWWYGLKKYGYTPMEYVYAEHKPQYISNKAYFSRPKEGKGSSDLIFLIKEPDQDYKRIAWEGEFEKYQLLKKEKFGPLEVEMRRKETSNF